MNQNNYSWSNQTGAVAILVAVSLVMIIGFAALSVDVGRRIMVGNEVQNAVDAGALAGAQALYILNSDNSSTFTPDNATAQATAATVANSAANLPASVVSVERGHWTFAIGSDARGEFTQNETETFYTFAEDDTSETLNVQPNWINAVKVTASTSGPVGNFFAGIFGRDSFTTTKDAVGYIGFAGRVPPDGVDMPIAICIDTIDEDRCSVGRMLSDTEQTARWTDFDQDACGTADNGELKNLTEKCAGNPTSILGGNGISTTNGVVDTVFRNFEDCFFGFDYQKDFDNDSEVRVMNATLPVIDCEPSGNCLNVKGFINVNVVWVLRDGNPKDEQAPYSLYNEEGTETVWVSDPADKDNGTRRWNDFAESLNLRYLDGELPEYKNPGGKTIYFKPTCKMEPPTGGSGGEFFGILSRIPVLVE